MSFRTRLLLACLALALVPLALFGLRARAEVSAQLGAQHEERVSALAEVIVEDLARESAAVAARLESVAGAMAADNRLRLALLDEGGADRAYLLDYAARAMPLAGLDLLRIQGDDGRVLSSGHFRQEHGAFDPELPAQLARAREEGMLVALPTPAGRRLGLARVHTLRVGTRTVTLVGASAVDERFLARLSRGSGLEVELQLPAAAAVSSAGPVREVAVPMAGTGEETAARFVIRASSQPLASIRREMDRWLAGTLAAATALALLLALAVSGRLGRPLAELARKAERVDLDRLDVDFRTPRRDEVGTLSRVLDRMTHRLRGSAVRLREAERQAAVGEMARQVNHDLKNGLIPIRNVLSHLGELVSERPESLPTVFEERRRTLESSLAYLESLAANYARLTPRLDRSPCDVNAIAREVARDAGVVAELAPALPAIHADPVALRRILENLVVNAVESLDGGPGRVVVWTRLGPRDGKAEAAGARILLGVTDGGRGLTAEERAQMFGDFYSTKPEGGGLGLSIVRRLVGDLGGGISVESEPGTGTSVIVELPVADAGGTA